MDLRVDYYFDDEAQHWGFRVPSLRIIGGGHDTRDEAEEAARQAILFTLQADELDTTPTEGAQIGHFHVTVEKAS
jgi:hypothetical protein